MNILKIIESIGFVKSNGWDNCDNIIEYNNRTTSKSGLYYNITIHKSNFRSRYLIFILKKDNGYFEISRSYHLDTNFYEEFVEEINELFKDEIKLFYRNNFIEEVFDIIK